MQMQDNVPSLLVIADDLTGANDAGVQFAKRGIRSLVLVGPDVIELPTGYDVLVVNTESRHAAPAIAAERVRRVAELGVRKGVSYFFKKTDSTLRGNIGAELQALLIATGEKTITFVPAFPETGRTTRHGIHFVHGVRLDESEFARDPLSPVTESRVATVVTTTTGLSTASRCAVPKKADWAEGCVVLDCESREQLRAIARELATQNRVRVLSGSAAFAEELPEILPLPAEQTKELHANLPILLVNGSLNPRALEQIGHASNTTFTRAKLTPEVLLQTGDETEFTRELKCLSGKNMLLYSAESRDEADEYVRKGLKAGMAGESLHLHIANRTGRIVAEILRDRAFQTLIVFGGDTLTGIARACDWNAFVPRTEISSGITVANPAGSELAVISKAGGFGNRDVVRTIVDWVRASVMRLGAP